MSLLLVAGGFAFYLVSIFAGKKSIVEETSNS